MRQSQPNPGRQLQNATKLIPLNSFYIMIESNVPVSDSDFTDAVSAWMNRGFNLTFPGSFISVVLAIDRNQQQRRKIQTEESVYFVKGAAIFIGSSSVSETQVLTAQSVILDDNMRLLQYLQLITTNITDAEASLDPVLPSDNNSTVPTPAPVSDSSPGDSVVELVNLKPFTLYMTVENATNIQVAIVLGAATQWLKESFPMYLETAGLVDGYAVFNTCVLTIDKSARRFLEVDYRQGFQGGVIFLRTAINSQVPTLQQVQTVQESIFESGTDVFVEILQKDFGLNDIYNLTVASTSPGATEFPAISNVPAPVGNGTISPTPMLNSTGVPVSNAPVGGTNMPAPISPVPDSNFTSNPNASLAPSQAPGSVPSTAPKPNPVPAPKPANVSGATLSSPWLLPVLMLIHILRWS